MAKLTGARRPIDARGLRGDDGSDGPKINPLTGTYLDPVEESGHAAGQKLARELRGADLGGVVYPSSRRAGGSCLAAFRTTLVQNIRQGATWELTWAGSPEFAVAEV